MFGFDLQKKKLILTLKLKIVNYFKKVILKPAKYVLTFS
jgi:hypothetical protein